MMRALTETSAKTKSRQWRVHWNRILIMAVLVYVLGGAVFSVVHLVQLWRQEHALSLKIATVSRENQTLRQDLRDLQNPVQLKAMLTGRRPIPSPIWTKP